MNEILKKRIEGAADTEMSQYYSNGEYSINIKDIQNNFKEAFKIGTEYAISHQWISVEDALPDRQEYDWVLIQIQMDDGFMCVPKIGEIRNDGYWHCAEYDELYKIGESFEKVMRCKVIAWMPIPKFEPKK